MGSGSPDSPSTAFRAGAGFDFGFSSASASFVRLVPPELLPPLPVEVLSLELLFSFEGSLREREKELPPEGDDALSAAFRRERGRS